MDMLVYDTGSNDYQICTYNTGEWHSRYLEYYQPITRISSIPLNWIPGKNTRYRVTTRGSSPYWFQITTSNGVYASAYV